MIQHITEDMWRAYEEQGYLILDAVDHAANIAALQHRIDEIMLGKAAIDYDRLMMQLDSDSGAYDQAGPQSSGHKGATLGYRKIQDLEFDPIFLRYMQLPIFESICQRVYPQAQSIKCFRAMFMNKPANKGTFLPWHQDRWRHLNLDPLLTVWTALDPATRENGCVQIIPGSHKLGVINPEHPSGFLTEAQARQHCDPARVVWLELQAGQVALLHNYLLHGSDVNRSSTSRRAFSVCYMTGQTVDVNSKHDYTTVFGPGALTVDQLGVKA